MTTTFTTPPPQFGNTPSSKPTKKAPGEAPPGLAPPQEPGEIGRIGPYRVIRQLGEGGLGVVYQAEDIHLKRMVALKMMKPDDLKDDLARQRFLREARSVAALEHENIVSIYQVGEDAGTPYIAMQLLQGETLEARIVRQKQLTIVESLEIARQTAAGLAAAHDRGLVHRDIKPANIWLEAGKDRVKILDFGLARGAVDTLHLTQTGVVVGTPMFMSPEQARGGAVDFRSDFYSLGCVLFTMLAGKPPIERDDPMAMFVALATESPEPLTRYCPDAPAPLTGLVNRLLAKLPASRADSAHDVLATIEAIQQVLPKYMPGVMTADWDRVSRAALATDESEEPRITRGSIILGTLFILLVAGFIGLMAAPQTAKKLFENVAGKKSN